MGGPQRLITYAVTAVNDGGESDPTVSDEVLTGDPYKLPVRINFEEAINWVNNGWTDSKNHYWWRKETGGVVRYSTNKVIWFKLGGKDGADFNSGKLDLTHAVKPTLIYTVAPEKNTQIEVNAILPDLTVKRLDVHGESTKKQYTVSLAPLKGLNNVIIQFHGSSTAADVWANSPAYACQDVRCTACRSNGCGYKLRHKACNGLYSTPVCQRQNGSRKGC